MAMSLYAIPFGEAFIIYRPLRRLAFIGNAAMATYVQRRAAGELVSRSSEIDLFLDSIHFWPPDMEVDPLPAVEDLRPAMGVLLLTNACNLRCAYCYAAAGDRPLEFMPWPVARRLIDVVCENALAADLDQFSLSFHGGGEPTVCWDVLKRAADHACGKALDCVLSLTSNGVWNEEQRRFIGTRFQQVSLSMDGAATVQNRQRPRRDGGPSFDDVMDSIAFLDEAGVEYGIRMTVLPESLSATLEGVAFICEHTRARSIQIEPTYTSARGAYADMDRAFGEAFADIMLDACELGQRRQRFVYYSAARPWAAFPIFCAAPLNALVMTPTGRLTTCFEVSSDSHPHAKDFMVGRVTEDAVQVDHGALQRFLDAREARRQGCRACFCYWHCAGDCATRALTSEPMTSTRCFINQRISRDLLAAYIEQGDGVWMGLREEPDRVDCLATAAPRKTRHEA